jgi:Amt family ammonium transporter
MRVDAGDTAWVLMCAALVMFMTPGIALFYAGVVRTKNVVSALMCCFTSIGIVTVAWVLVGHTLAFGPDIGEAIGRGGWIGGLDFLGFRSVGVAPLALAPTAPHAAFAIFELALAVFAAALIAGANVERFRSSAYLAFTTAWVLVVYAPVAHWMWGDGLLGPRGLGALDSGGGIVVLQSAGMAAFAAALVVGRRTPSPDGVPVPRNVEFVVLGASVLWFGWLGLNGGSSHAAGGAAAIAVANTQLAAAAGILGWLVPEWAEHGEPTTVGAVRGAIAGLVAITPASGFVRPGAAILIGGFAACICYFARRLGERFNHDDALDVVAVVYVGGLVGTILTGVFAAKIGSIASGSFTQVAKQAVGSLIVTVWSFALSYVILKVVDWTIGVRASDVDAGLDLARHGETAYNAGTGGQV